MDGDTAIFLSAGSEASNFAADAHKLGCRLQVVNSTSLHRTLVANGIPHEHVLDRDTSQLLDDLLGTLSNEFALTGRVVLVMAFDCSLNLDTFHTNSRLR